LKIIKNCGSLYKFISYLNKWPTLSPPIFYPSIIKKSRLILQQRQKKNNKLYYLLLIDSIWLIEKWHTVMKRFIVFIYNGKRKAMRSRRVTVRRKFHKFINHVIVNISNTWDSIKLWNLRTFSYKERHQKGMWMEF